MFLFATIMGVVTKKGQDAWTRVAVASLVVAFLVIVPYGMFANSNPEQDIQKRFDEQIIQETAQAQLERSLQDYHEATRDALVIVNKERAALAEYDAKKLTESLRREANQQNDKALVVKSIDQLTSDIRASTQEVLTRERLR